MCLERTARESSDGQGSQCLVNVTEGPIQNLFLQPNTFKSNEAGFAPCKAFVKQVVPF